MRVGGWGRHPLIDAQLEAPATPLGAQRLISGRFEGAPRGRGRSYGDSALAPWLLSTRWLDLLGDFDPQTGTLSCGAGVSLDTLLSVFVPRGWFLPVTPGTRYVSVGGAVACDVHGKNHHQDGSFCDHVEALELVLGTGERVRCGPTERPELFAATCGGMGLTGLITSVTLRLRPIEGALIDTQTLRCAGLGGLLEAFDAHADAPYSVAWVDTLATGASLGRGLLFLGAHASAGPLRPGRPARLWVPPGVPGWALSRPMNHAFNALYYHRPGRAGSGRVHYQPYFYPLDGVRAWNRLYGRAGFMQYQLALPRVAGAEGLREALGLVSASGRGSFLAVLKAFGPGSARPLSFPIEGYTLTIDFKVAPGLEALLQRLDALVVDHGGRVYLAKDARLSRDRFRQMYPGWEALAELRARTGADRVFHSLQSRRLGL